MRRKRTSPQEQLRLIQACRQSGLTDLDWCQAHGIPPATFYGWIHRLKQKGEMEVPAGVPTIVRKEAGPPDIVKIVIEAEGEIAQNREGSPSACTSGMAEEFPAPCLDSNCPVMEVVIQGISLRVKASSACSTRWRAKRQRRLRRNRMRRKNPPPLPGRAGPGRERKNCSGASP